MNPRRALVASCVAALVLGGLVLAPLGPGRSTCAAAAGAHHAAVVVRHADGTGFDAPGVCVSFPQAAITVESALQLAAAQYHLDYAVVNYDSSFGDELCQVDREPAAPAEGWTTDNCFHGGYWEVFTATPGGSWHSTQSGISNAMLQDGGAAGFSYQPSGKLQPGPPAPAGICPAAQASSPPATPATGAPRKPPASAPPTPATPVASSLAVPAATPAGEVAVASEPTPSSAAPAGRLSPVRGGFPQPPRWPDWTGAGLASLAAAVMLGLLAARLARSAR